MKRRGFIASLCTTTLAGCADTVSNNRGTESRDPESRIQIQRLSVANLKENAISGEVRVLQENKELFQTEIGLEPNRAEAFSLDIEVTPPIEVEMDTEPIQRISEFKDSSIERSTSS
jgi:hypothetical protein